MTLSPPSRIRLMMTGAIGNIIEYYDFALFGYLATIIGANFFPSDNPAVSVVAAFGAFAVGAIMRPVGAVIFGHIGAPECPDKRPIAVPLPATLRRLPAIRIILSAIFYPFYAG